MVFATLMTQGGTTCGTNGAVLSSKISRFIFWNLPPSFRRNLRGQLCHDYQAVKQRKAQMIKARVSTIPATSHDITLNESRERTFPSTMRSLVCYKFATGDSMPRLRRAMTRRERVWKHGAGQPIPPDYHIDARTRRDRKSVVEGTTCCPGREPRCA